MAMHDTDLILLPCLPTVNKSNAFTLTNRVSIRTPSSHIIGNLPQTNVWRVPDAMFLKSSCYQEMHNIGPVMLRDLSGDFIAMSQMLTQDPESRMKAKGTFMGRTINCDNSFFTQKYYKRQTSWWLGSQESYEIIPDRCQDNLSWLYLL